MRSRNRLHIAATVAASVAIAVTALFGAGNDRAAWAQDPRSAGAAPGQDSLDSNGRLQPINAAKDVSLDQKLDAQVTLATPFRDEAGKTVPLSTYFGKKPVIVVLPFYRCPGICTQELDGMIDAFAKLKYKVGRDFEVVTISINPKEGADLATAKKREYLAMLNQPGADLGWHFLTGDQSSIKKFADEIGFRYVYDVKTDQYAHPSGIILLTPQGKVSRYLYGVSYPDKDLRLALTEAGQGKIGSVAEKIILYCYHYDPQQGTYGLAIFRVMQVAGFATVFIVGSFMLMMFRKDVKDGASRRNGLPGAALVGGATSGDGTTLNNTNRR